MNSSARTLRGSRRNVNEVRTDDDDHGSEFLRRFLDGLPPVAYWDTDLRNRAYNKAFVEFFGLSADAIEGQPMSELLWPDVFALAQPYAERALSGVPQQYDRVTVDPGGVTRYAQVSLVPDIVDGQVRGIVSHAADITERRRAELALAATEARFKLTFMASPVGIATVEGSGILTQVNPAFGQILDYPPAALAGRRLVDLLSGGVKSETGERIAHLFEPQTEPSSFECELGRRDGSVVAVILSFALAQEEGHDELMGIVQLQDITERKRAEEALRRSQEQLSQAEQIAGTGTWEWELATDRISWSAGLFHIFRLAPEEFETGLEVGLRQRVYPEDRDRVRQALHRAVDMRASLTIENRIVRADGRVRTLLTRADVVVDDNGTPIRVVAVVQDITEAKLAQDALRNASSDLAQHARELQGLTVGAQKTREQVLRGSLSERQLETLELVAEGLTNAEIAKRMFISETTVKWHIKQILIKTGSANRAEAVARVLGGERR